MSGARLLARQAGAFTVLIYGANAVNALAALLVARALGPEGAGLWGIARVLANYLGWAQAGVLDAASREIPFQAARGDEDGARRAQDAALSHLALCAAALGAACLAGLVVSGAGGRARTLLLFLAFYVPVLQAVNGALTVLRARKRFLDIAVAALAVALINLVVGPAAARKLGLGPFLAAMVLLNAANLAFWLARSREEPWCAFSWRWRRPEVSRLMGVGLPMFLGGVGFTLLTTVDSLVVARFVDPVSLGCYTFAASLCTYVFQVPNAVSVVTFPHFQERHAQGGGPEALRRLFLAPTILFACVLLPPLVAAAYFGAPWLVETALPRFRPALPVLRVMLVGVYFASLTQMAGQLLITLDKQTRALPIVLAAATANAAGCLAALALGTGPVGAATAAAAANVLFFLALFGYASSLVQDAWSSARDAAVLVGCGAATFAAMAAAERFVPGTAGGWSGLGVAGARIALACALASPLTLYAERRTGFWRDLGWSWRFAPKSRRGATEGVQNDV